ncbi:MAG: hypothetical protein WB424_07725 [Terracidiphilus sp.]|jgi:hypothetical protein
MASIVPIDNGNLTKEELASTISTYENDYQKVLVSLSTDTVNSRNLGGFDPQPYGATLGLVAIVDAGADAPANATKIQSNKTIYIKKSLTAVDVYRLPV